MSALWSDLPANLQDMLRLVLLVLPALILGLAVVRGFAPGPLVRALLKRFAWANGVFVVLIAASVALGIGLISQERGVRLGTAAAAEKFELIVSAPGSEVTMMLASVYLHPTQVPLLSGSAYAEIERHPMVELAAPLAFGDSWNGAPIIGTTSTFVAHLTDDAWEGRLWTTVREGVAGAHVPLSIGQTIEPAHGHGTAAVAGAHAGETITIVGRLAPTGSPWDNAILIPIEDVWLTHGLANGHAPARADQLGGPFDAAYFPGTPAAVVKAKSLGDAYALRATFTREAEMMAFFPGAVLSQLYRVMGDIRQAMSAMALLSQALVALAVLLGLFIFTQVFSPQMAMLRALGAPRRFVMAIVWLYATSLLAFGALLGLALGVFAARLISHYVSAETGISLPATIGWREVHLIAAFTSLASLLSILPAWISSQRPVIDALRR